MRQWTVEAAPELEGLPESVWPWIGDLSNSDEDGGVFLGYGMWEDRFIVAGGPRAYLLVQSVRRRLAAGTERSEAATQLRLARERGKGDYVLGIAIDGSRLNDLAESDRTALRRSFRAGASALVPSVISLAGFHHDGDLWLEGRVLY